MRAARFVWGTQMKTVSNRQFGFQFRRVAGLAFALVTLFAVSGAGDISRNRTAAAADTKITSALVQAFSESPLANTRYIAVLAEQADPANSITDWDAKGRYVLDTLRSKANATQPNVASLLATQRSLGNVERFKSYYIINAFAVWGNLASAEALATLPEVATIDVFPEVTLDTASMAPSASPASVQSAASSADWNVEMVRAPQAWALGYDGTGMTIGSLDTGVRYTHSAIVGKYRGNLGGVFDHNYNWWDAVTGQAAPYDTQGHGTHTTGTLVGDDGLGNRVGVAPGAKWIATKGIADDVTADPDIVEAGQWILAPWDLSGQNADPNKRPVVVGNSWGYGAAGLVFPACSTATFFRDIVQAWTAAGIFPSFSAGNSTVGTKPPAAYPETFETGGLTNGFKIASYSSRGPSCFDNGQHPQLMAGGGDAGFTLDSFVRSASNTSDTGYAYQAGTSMAQPAVAGAVAILKQANPDLTIAETWNILTSTAYFDPSWGERPNDQYGWGLLQIDAAVKKAIPPPPDFNVSANPATQNVKRGQSTTYSVNLGSVNGFAGGVNLRVSGLPAKTTATFSPNPATLSAGGSASSTLLIKTQKATPTGSYTLTITGTGGNPSLSRSAEVTLVVGK